MIGPSANILIGISGGIAAYKTCELIRLFKKAGHNVKVVMTENAHAFVTPTTLATLSGEPVYHHTFDENHDPMMHIQLAKWASHIIIAPATANIIAKITHGVADDLLSTICLATKAPINIAPAMNKVMWENAATQENILQLTSRGVNVLPTGEGEQACGDVGYGRMLEPSAIFETLIGNHTSQLAGKKVLITAGPTIEPIDPVRYISNHSSGKMGYAIAKACVAEGATVTLISGRTGLDAPKGCHVIPITTAADMLDVVMREIKVQDIFFAAAAVADFCVATPTTEKIKKCDDAFQLTLQKTPDILAMVGQLTHKPLIVGFCAETDALEVRAIEKCQRKACDFIVANYIQSDGYPFYADNNTVVVFDKTGAKRLEATGSKHAIASQLLSTLIQHPNEQ